MLAGLRFRQTIGNNGTQSYGANAQGVLRNARRVAFSKPRETAGRKANWGLRRYGAMTARLPDTLHPKLNRKGRKENEIC